MKYIVNVVLSGVLCFLLGCATLAKIGGFNFPPDNSSSVEALITYEYDEFDKSGWLKSALYLGKPEKAYGADILYNYRANYNDKSELQFIQLYMKLRSSSSWYFIDRVADSNGKSYPFSKISRDVMSAQAVHEIYAITLTKEELIKFTEKDIRLKSRGSKRSLIIPVSKFVSEGFLNALNNQ